MENTIIKEKEAVHCKTEEEAKEVLAIADKLGLQWASERSYLESTNWDRSRSNICYYLGEGMFGSVETLEIGYSIISAEEFVKRYEAFKNRFEERSLSPESILQEAKQIIDNDPEKESILQEAERIVNGDRQADYADPVENFERIANIASILNGREMTAKECCIVMIAVKLSREANKPKRDNRVDLCGYIHILDKIESEKRITQ